MKRSKITIKRHRLNMTPMIDVVFLLLAFFVMTFKIIVPEADFNVNMTGEGQAVAAEVPQEPVRVELTAEKNGALSAILLNKETLKNFTELRERIKALAKVKPDLEIEMAPDETLYYEYVIEAVSAVNGEVSGGQVKKICDKIKFVKQNKNK